MRIGLLLMILSFAGFAQASSVEVGAGVSGKYIECMLPDGKVVYEPEMICKRHDGKAM
ncbi:hypothetical protein [Vibrio sonorensis]|uniref:hypothetical protein n=1 Tax=Vibrio sonorensis TaxID=1004316 RepID=UPI001585E41B|nr:hypothetical protein [Vibrio sonorensis]